MFMYIIYALVGALMASFGTIFAKLGLKGVDSNLLTAIRGLVMALVVVVFAISYGKFSVSALSSLTQKQWLYVILSGLAGALSWLFFYYALSQGTAIHVTVIDKFSLVITAVLAFLILGEGITLQSGIGLLLIVVGTLLVVFK